MAHNQRDLAYTNKIQSFSNDSGKQLKRSPSFGDWSGAGENLNTLAGKPEVKTEPYTDELPCPKSPTRVPKTCLGARKQMLSPRQNPKTADQHRATPARGPSTGPSAIPQTYSGMKRKASAPDLKVLPEPSLAVSNIIQKSPVDDFFCEVCQVNCSSSLTLSDHLKGKKHKAKLTWSREKRFSNVEPKETSPRCDLCQICCTDRVALEMHYKGKKHMAKLQEIENEEAGAKKPVRCELCGISCMNEDAFQQHLEGRQHAHQVQLVRRGLN